MTETSVGHAGRMSDQSRGGPPSPDQKPDLERVPDEDIPDFDKGGPGESPWDDERGRQERGNRGPDEEPGFGQGA